MLSAGFGAWAMICATFLLAGLVKGVVGMGLPTVAMGLLAVILSPVEAATLLLVPSFVTNVWQLFAGPSFWGLAARLCTMMLGIILGTIGGAGLLAGGHATAATTALGLALGLYAILGLCHVRFSVCARHEAWLSPLIGAVTGLITGATGVFVLPAVPYLQALRLEKDDLVQALGLSFTVSTVALGAGLFRAGAFSSAPTPVLGSLLALAAALAGMFAGQSLRQRMSLEAFRRAFFIGLLLLGFYLALQGVLGV